jgi:hypothetical protein
VLVDGPVSGFSFSDVGFITSGKNLTSGKNITANFNVISLSADLFNDYSPTGSNLVNGKNLVSGKNLTSGKNLVSGKNIVANNPTYTNTILDPASTDNTIVMIDADDVDAGEVTTFAPINLITGLSVNATNYIIPGAYFSAGLNSQR